MHVVRHLFGYDVRPALLVFLVGHERKVDLLCELQQLLQRLRAVEVVDEDLVLDCLHAHAGRRDLQEVEPLALHALRSDRGGGVPAVRTGIHKDHACGLVVDELPARVHGVLVLEEHEHLFVPRRYQRGAHARLHPLEPLVVPRVLVQVIAKVGPEVVAAVRVILCRRRLHRRRRRPLRPVLGGLSLPLGRLLLRWRYRHLAPASLSAARVSQPVRTAPQSRVTLRSEPTPCRAPPQAPHVTAGPGRRCLPPPARPAPARGAPPGPSRARGRVVPAWFQLQSARQRDQERPSKPCSPLAWY